LAGEHSKVKELKITKAHTMTPPIYWLYFPKKKITGSTVRSFESRFLSGWTVGSSAGRMRHYEMAHEEPLDKVVERPDKAHRDFP
jgi:hypothetical protein